MNPILVNLLCAGIPSLVSGIGLHLISKNMQAHQEKVKKQEDDRVTNEKYIMNTLIATAEGTEAIAKAIQRVPEAHCNGDMTEAIKKVEDALEEQRDFLREKAVEATSK